MLTGIVLVRRFVGQFLETKHFLRSLLFLFLIEFYNIKNTHLSVYSTLLSIDYRIGIRENDWHFLEDDQLHEYNCIKITQINIVCSNNVKIKNR